eukprot:s4776_g2.t1
MYLQGPSRSGGGARFEEAGYAVSALQAGLQFFMEEGRPATSTGPSVFSCLPQGAPGTGPEEASLAMLDGSRTPTLGGLKPNRRPQQVPQQGPQQGPDLSRICRV